MTACSAATDGVGDAAPVPEPPGTVHARFDLRGESLPWGAIPWPDDLYLHGAGHPAVTGLPLRDRAASDVIEDALARLNGFGVRPTMRVAFDGAIDPSSLPSDAEASLLADAAVFLLDADLSSARAFERVPIVWRLAEEDRVLRVQAANGRALQPGRRYALVVTSALRGGDDALRVAPAAAFARLLDPNAQARDQRELSARTQYEPVLSALEEDGLARSQVASLAVFTIQDVDRDLDEARSAVRARDPAAIDIREVITGGDLDDLLGEAPEGTAGIVRGEGAAHEHLAALVQLNVQTPVFASVVHGERTAFTRDEAGVLEVQGEHSVPCVLLVPRSIGGASGLPVALFAHGLGGDRSDAVALGNELAAAGHAVLACDLPLHGSRSPRGDERNRFTGDDAPDGFGDTPGDLLGTTNSAGELGAHHPFYYRDALRQAAVEWMAIVAALESRAWDEALAAHEAFEGVTLAADGYGIVGVDIGAEVAMAVASREPAIGASVLAFAGGAMLDDWLASPGFGDQAEAIARALDLGPIESDDVLFEPDVDLLRMTLDGASGLTQAARLRRSDTNVLMLMAADDERVRNASSEALAFALGLSLVGGAARFEPDLMLDNLLPGSAIEGNIELPTGRMTRIVQSIEPATSSALVTVASRRRYATPITLPFEPLDEPRPVLNPTGAVLRQIAFFFESYRVCRAADPSRQRTCPASLSALERTSDLGVRE